MESGGRAGRIAAVALVVCALAAGPGIAASPAPSGPSPSSAIVDRAPLALGVSRIEGHSAQPDDDLESVDAFAAATGRMPATWSIWSDWGGINAGFPDPALLDGLAERGVLPVLFWQPTNPDVTWQPERYADDRIAAGDWDAYLTEWATDAAAWGGPIVVRWAQEMNAPWFPWAMGKVGNTPAGFIAAWRHLVTLIQPIAPQIRFLWSPNAPCGARCTALAALYPGDDVVDLVGFDVYAWRPRDLMPMTDLYAAPMAELRALTARPVVVAETGAAGPADARAGWIRDGYTTLLDTYPEIAAVLWFDIDMRVANQPDWRLRASDGSLAAYAALLTDPRFQGALEPLPAVATVAALGGSASPAP